MSLFSKIKSQKSESAEPAGEQEGQPSIARFAKLVAGKKTDDSSSADLSFLSGIGSDEKAVKVEGVACVDGDPEKTANGWFMHMYQGHEIREHFVNGLLHRDDGPAYIKDGEFKTEGWAINGVYHRTDGPAIISKHPDGLVQEHFFVDGVAVRKMGVFPDGGSIETFCTGSLFFWERHNDKGPAVIYRDKDGAIVREEYYLNGSLHRVGDKPAITAGKHMEWWDRGELHRSSGPAIVTAKGEKRYFLEGREVGRNEVSKAAVENSHNQGIGEADQDTQAPSDGGKREEEMRNRIGSWKKEKANKPRPRGR